MCMAEAVSIKSAAAWPRALRHCVIRVNSGTAATAYDSTTKYIIYKIKNIVEEFGPSDSDTNFV